MISTITNKIPEDLPLQYQPNLFVQNPEYKKWSDNVQPVNNVNEGAYVWCKPDTLLTESSQSLNQTLAGLPDPKTLVQPLVSIPIYDNSVWKSNDFMVPKGINDQRRQELWQNGYLIDDIADYVRQTYGCNREEDRVADHVDAREDFRFGSETMSKDEKQCLASSNLSNQSLYPNNSNPYVWNEFMEKEASEAMSPPFLTEYGYYPSNEAVNLPTNDPAGYCEKRPEMAEYNQNIYTTTLQPGVYSKTQVNQPDSVMSNMGISYTQPFLPTYSSYVQRKDSLEKEGVLYTQYDPNFAPRYDCRNVETGVPQETIYDPRYYGYGTDYRSYVDELTGRPKFYYDDIDVNRRNKFITRNKIDFEPFGLQNGAQEPSCLSNMDVRERAQNAFLDNALSFRTELQQRLMQKNTNREWQQKKAPIITNQFTRGGSSGVRGTHPTGYAGPRG